MADHESWGRFPKASQRALPVQWRGDSLPASDATLLPHGLGRSYGDSCLNDGGALLATRGLSRLISFDRAGGVIRCEAGVSLSEILDLVVPAGWFLPVTPGTKFVTVGGAIANDVHGKNHVADGTFGRFVRSLELLRSDGTRLVCSPEQNAEWFQATIGGLGLTGLVTWAEFQLRPIHNPFIEAQTVRFGGLDEFFSLNDESERDYVYTVAWIDILATGKHLGRGIYHRGNHAAPFPDGPPPVRRPRKLTVPFDFPGFLVNPLTVRAFNFAYYNQQLRKVKSANTEFEPFFYPLDKVLRWNRVYGRRGFLQWQCVVPPEAARPILAEIARSREGSPLVVFKTFGSKASPGLLSFPRPGATLAIDFRNRGEKVFALLDRLDALVRESGGAIYPAKDARMSGETFRRSFPKLDEFSRFVDPRFSSSFWRRVDGANGRLSP
ncbi:FAD-binding oxidoreductase [Vulgatibacter incomptus]|uniref:Oxidoreductase, FAD-binding n=1 Tax=Vulgatibacter incomptus TaxID=1391653 RepID=A0A0K1P8V8_9BACT|nr:FAD-binding oxidoreductase [Vulgatibacter incomptus]AKU89942.1 Oxidoreductase, FAD-binding [Vulgatibacter incomptus]